MSYTPLQSPPPFAHQRETWEQTRHLPAWGLLFEQRCGKSRVLLDTAGWLFAEGKIKGLLVIAPKEVCRTAWEQEQTPRFLNVPHEILRWRGSSGHTKKWREKFDQFWKPSGKLKVFIVNVEAFSGVSGDSMKKVCVGFLKAFPSLIGVDESSTIKERTSKRTERILALADYAPYRRILTGTPVTQTPLDCFTQFGFLDTKLFGSNFFSFRARYAVLSDTYTKQNGTVRTVKTVSGYRNLDELKDRIQTLSTRVMRADCFDLPPKVYARVDIEISDEVRRIYNKMVENEVAALLAEGIVTPALALSRSMSLRQITSEFLLQKDEVTGETRKIEFGRQRAKQLIATLRESTGKTIVWTVFRHSQAVVMEALAEAKIPAVALVGETPDAERQQAVDKFRGPVDVIVVNQRIGQFGLDLSVADNVVYLEHDWSVERRMQSEDRAQHPARTKSVGYTDFVMPGTIDEVMLNAVRAGRALADVVAGEGWRTIFKEISDDQL